MSRTRKKTPQLVTCSRCTEVFESELKPWQVESIRAACPDCRVAREALIKLTGDEAVWLWLERTIAHAAQSAAGDAVREVASRF